MHFNILTFNIQSCRDYVKRDFNPELMAKTIKEINPDIIGLNEVRNDGGDKDFTNQTRFIANYLGYKYYFFAQAINVKDKGPYGIAIISKYEIKDLEVVKIPDPLVKDEDAYYESRVLLKSKVNINNELINVFITHIGLARQEQINAINTIINETKKVKGKILLMGDFNIEPDDNLLKQINKYYYDTSCQLENDFLTFPSIDPIKKIDYIYTKDLKVLKTQIIKKVASDHFPLAATLSL